MANNNIDKITYENIISSNTANPLMIQYERGLAAPMDITDVFATLNGAKDYSISGNNAYVGKTLSVIENNKVDVYKINHDSNIERLLSETDLVQIEGKIPDASKFAEKSYVDEKIKDINLDGYATSADVMTVKDISVNGGEWASVIGSVFGNTIKSGLTFQEFLEKMVNVEKFPQKVNSSTVLLVECDTPSGGISVGNNSTLEIGTKVTVYKINAKATNVNHYIVTSGLEYGYKLTETGNHNSNTSYKQDFKQPKLVNSGNTLKVILSGFTDYNGAIVGTKTGTSSIESFDIYVGSGTNKIQIAQSGNTYSVTQTESPDIIFIASNMGNYSAYTPVITSMSKTASNSTIYTLNGYSKVFYGTTNNDEDINDFNFRSYLKSTTNTLSDKKIELKTIYENNHNRMIIACPTTLVVESVKNAGGSQDITNNFKLVSADIPCANENIKFEYNVYDASWPGSFGNETWIITFR